MKAKLLKLTVLSLLIAAGLYFSGGVNVIGKVALIHFLRLKQGVVTFVEHVSLAPPLDLTLAKAQFSSSYEADCKLFEMEKVGVKLAFDKSNGYRLVPATISLEGGTIYGRGLAKHLSLRKEERDRQRQAAGAATASAGNDRATASAGSGSASSSNAENPSTALEVPETVRQLLLSDVTLDGGTVLVNLLIVKKEVSVKIQHINADLMVKGDRFFINHFSWKMGPLNPSVQNREFDLSVLQDPSKMNGIPKEVRGIFVLANILLGEGKSQ